MFTGPFPAVVPNCVTVTTQGNNVHVTVRGTNNQVIESACTVNPTFSCGTPINLGTAAFRMAYLPSRHHKIAIFDR
ncbi:hypothetical protein [Actinoallomurus sp. NPDC052274]|uniref:hypothetical protein n=1 Tax=Actinoallomurus sp. NPDC052274 TaxID=3155420 RepID=UPI0034166206